MNYKQKLGYMAIGAGILAIGIIIGQIITPDIEAQSNAQDDDIISIVDLSESSNRIMILELLYKELEIEKLHLSDLKEADKRARIVETQVLILSSIREELHLVTR